jgi:predicted DNA-binding transcriptional regulator AlpA
MRNIETKKYLTREQVCQRYAKSKAWLERRLRTDAKFPRPTQLGGRVRLWDETELADYERAIVAAERAARDAA